MTKTMVEVPKMFREIDGMVLKNVQLPYALKTIKISLRRKQNSDLLFIKSLNRFVHPCTKECILLYKTINSFVQKKDLFCTRSHKYHS